MNEKRFFLPEVSAQPAGEETPPAEPKGKYPCPCCGFITLSFPPKEAVAYICPVCFWENDVFIASDDEPSDENHGLTLCQGRANYRKWGAVTKDRLPYVRPPKPEEAPAGI